MFSLDYFYFTKYHWKFEQGAKTASCKKFVIALQLYQKETLAQLFSCNFCEIFQNTCCSESSFTVAFFLFNSFNKANIYLLKVSKRNTWKKCEIYSKSTIKASKRRYWRCFAVHIVNFGHVSHVFLLFLLLKFEQVNVDVDVMLLLLLILDMFHMIF